MSREKKIEYEVLLYDDSYSELWVKRFNDLDEARSFVKKSMGKIVSDPRGKVTKARIHDNKGNLVEMIE